jgi:hypothetical protein
MPERGVGRIPGRGRWLEALLAIAALVVIVAVMTLLVWEVLPATSGAEDATLKAGVVSAVIHDDAANMPLGAGSAVVHDDAGKARPD